MKQLFILILASHSILLAFSQKSSTLSGQVVDSLNKAPVYSATISLLDPVDSSLVSFSMTDEAGKFAFQRVKEGKYRLLITHVSYEPFSQIIDAGEKAEHNNLGQLRLSKAGVTLGEVRINSESPPVTMINDTIQYNAGSFKTQPNANVEQLLKKMPGIKVEKDGTVKAQGEKVKRVLVDGKEFFGSDPKIATKNLPADAVDKVQVYDKQSDQAQLTGFDDGNAEKTINLKLKKDKKKGSFGKASVAAGTSDRYESRLNVNSFKGARQLSVLGMSNNTNAEGFSFMDILNFTGELNRMQRNGGGNININFSDDDAATYGIGTNRNGGIRTAMGGGINYNNIIGKNLDVQDNYFFNRIGYKADNFISRQYILPDSAYYFNQHSLANNQNNNHRFNFNTLWQIDSFHSLRITPSLSIQHTNNASQNNYSTYSQQQLITNEGFSNNQLTNEGFQFINDLIYRQKMKRRGRTMSLSIQTSVNESDGSGSLLSINRFYDQQGNSTRIDSLDQQNKTRAKLYGYMAKFVYTEPLFKRSLFEISLSKGNTQNTSNRTTFDYNRNTEKHDQVNASLSNDYTNRYALHTAGIRLRTQRRKYNFALGIAGQVASLEGANANTAKDSSLNRRFRNLLPTARFQYNFSKFKSLTVNYVASTNQPTISQLQPVPDNSNSLNIRTGNPDLKPEYIHTVQAQLNIVSPFRNKNLFWLFNLQSAQHRIVNADSINSLGVKSTRPVNVNGVYILNSNIQYSFPVKPLKATVELSSAINFNKGKQFVNGIINHIRSFSAGPEIRIDMNPHRKINVTAGMALRYNQSRYSLQPAFNNTYLQHEYNVGLDWELPKRIYFSTDLMYTINSRRSDDFNTNIATWNASISKQFMKNNRGELKVMANDLLNMNLGINRTSNQNYIEDSRVNTLRRFFLLQFTYSLSKTGLNNAGGGMRVFTR
ncbi:MAG TPA: outer membrane beta-barrel protein [Ferruginibacter sp.]|nr:outer membrane beta-barrel protein [Ferruginibacter sp.]